MRAVFVTNFCPHYRVGAFEELARRMLVNFYFFSESEPYWEKRNPTGGGKFAHVQLSGFPLLPRVRVSPGLIWHLLRDDYAIVIKCTNGRFALPVSYLIAKLRRKKFILWQTIWYHPATFFHRLSYPLQKHIWMHADAIVVYGEHGKRFLESEGVSSGKIRIAWQAVDNSSFNRSVTDSEQSELRQRLGLQQKKIILYVGQLIPVKGLPFLIEALRLIERQDVTLLIVGRGPLEEGLKHQYGNAGNVLFLGYLPPHELPVLYAAASALVLPSVSLPHVKEAWGLVVNEAMNQGCPAVVTDAVGAGVGGLVHNGKNGFVVPERNAEALAAAINKILSDNELASRMREEAARTIKEWTFERWAAGFVEAVQYATRNPR